MKTTDLNEKIEVLRMDLNKLVQLFGTDASIVLAKSAELDKLINQYYQR